MSEPSQVFRDVAARHRRCFWLDRTHARGWAGLGPVIGWLEKDDVSLSYDAVTGTVTRQTESTSEVVGDDIFATLEDEVRLGPPAALWVGFFGYAARGDLPAAASSDAPDAVWLRTRHWQRAGPAGPAGAGLPSSGVGAPTPSGLTDPDAYAAAFDRIQEHLHAGDSYEVNLTYRAIVDADPDPVTTYLALRRHNPAPYTGFLQHDLPDARVWLLSSSPECFASVTADRRIETRPIKGTTTRGETPEEDAVQAARLASEPTFRAENLMIVDLMRNDLSRVCTPGTVEVPGLMVVEHYARVHQLVSTVIGRLDPGVSTVAALRSIFPPGSMTGAPKLRTMQIIEEVESSPRGVYAGAFGWLTPDGRADLGVVIRSLVTTGDGTWSLGTGGGITVGSEVTAELAETCAKAAALLEALGLRSR